MLCHIETAFVSFSHSGTVLPVIMHIEHYPKPQIFMFARIRVHVVHVPSLSNTSPSKAMCHIEV